MAAGLCQAAVSDEVIVMVDAEYTYLNPALGLFALAMMLVCNEPSQRPPLVFHTYQNYLKVGTIHADWPYSQLSWPITLTKGQRPPLIFPHLSELPEGRYTCRLALFTTVLACNTYQNDLKVRVLHSSSTLTRTT